MLFLFCYSQNIKLIDLHPILLFAKNLTRIAAENKNVVFQNLNTVISPKKGKIKCVLSQKDMV